MIQTTSQIYVNKEDGNQNTEQIVDVEKQKSKGWKVTMLVLTIHITDGKLLAAASSCHEGTRPSLTGALKGQARPNILVLTGRGLLVTPRSLKLCGILLLLLRREITSLVFVPW